MNFAARDISKQDVLTFRGFFVHDIPVSISARTNLLTALGLVCYTEFIGGLIRGRVGVKQDNRLNFYAAYDLLGDHYKAFDHQLKQNFDAVFYDFFRNGLAHEYFAKGIFVISPHSNTNKGIGFHNGEAPSLATEPYYEDLLRVLDDFIKESA